MLYFLLFCLSYFACPEAMGERTPSLVIVTYKVQGAPNWDPDSIKKGITGSEEAVIYMAEQLAKSYQVTVLGSPPENSPYTLEGCNPRYLDLSAYKGERYDIAIGWRLPTSGNSLKRMANYAYLWPHDTFDGKLSPEQIDSFDGVLWISKYQRDYWTSINPGFAKFEPIFGNGISPEQFFPISERSNPYACIYGSNYGRGLEILLNIWPAIKAKHPRATLDIYYGWQHWGLLSPEKEKAMRQQINNYAYLGVKEHGLVSHKELNKAYSQASFWTYPCYSIEVFCITAIRAQMSGAIPVIIDGSAFPETVRHGYRCHTSEEYFNLLDKAMSEVDSISLEQRKEMKAFILQEYTWEKIAEKWKNLFDTKLKRQA